MFKQWLTLEPDYRFTIQGSGISRIVREDGSCFAIILIICVLAISPPKSGRKILLIGERMRARKRISVRVLAIPHSKKRINHHNLAP